MDYLHDAFSIEIVEYKEWNERNRKNNFFELVYILKGKGLQSVSYLKQRYIEGSLFLLPAAKWDQVENLGIRVINTNIGRSHS